EHGSRSLSGQLFPRFERSSFDQLNDLSGQSLSHARNFQQAGQALLLGDLAHFCGPGLDGFRRHAIRAQSKRILAAHFHQRSHLVEAASDLFVGHEFVSEARARARAKLPSLTVGLLTQRMVNGKSSDQRPGRFPIHDLRFTIHPLPGIQNGPQTLSKSSPHKITSEVNMRLRKFLCALVVALFSLQTFQFAARADEGMWPFNNIPRAEIKKRYGFDVTDEWLKKVQLASVRFNSGGSGSFVSSTGLVLTNYHIVEDFVGELSTPQKDYAKEGFVARTRADEMKIPNLELNVLMSIEDVTPRVNGAVKPGMSDAEAFGARRKEITAIEAESTKATGLRSDVITLYQGGQYNLYRYKKYTDVRLVFVPEF